MQTLLRWIKFNLVGVIGMGVQLAALALFNHLLHGHYLVATAIALELSLLHNFVWHTHITWRDRRANTSWPRQLFRFHISNGLVSLTGNLALMRLLVHTAHLPLLSANVIAIACCSIANFTLSHRWAFAETPLPRDIAPSRTILLTGAILVAAAAAPAQAQSLPETPLPQASPASTRQPFTDIFPSYAGVFCGTGASSSSLALKPTVGCGLGATLFLVPLFVEIGILGPQANRSYLSGYVSLDGNIPLARTSARYFPIAIVGYSRLFETGHALDYGLALVLPRARGHANDFSRVRVELRDYWTFANPTQHNILLRFGWVSPVTD